MKRLFVLLFVLLLSACNSVYINGTMQPNSVVHAKPGGYGIKRSIKEQLEKRGYDVRIGKLKKAYAGDLSERETLELPGNIKYVIRVDESKEYFMPWCIFNGFWWWRFSLSVTDQKDGREILSWRGRGCQNSSLRKLNDILNELERTKREEK
ncbi:MAG: hypothetical protein K6B71_03060 [Alphaproteobacteria bacterium]|nr:hypothetical protein [Alphaproteobacteria bacterium]